MRKITICSKINLGYQIHKRKTEVDLFEACDILRSRKQKYITSVEREGDKAIIYSHRITCPHCGKETPAYSHYWDKCSLAFPKKSVAEIMEWANIQPSLINESDKKMQIQLNENFWGEYICPKCGYSSEKSTEYADFYINYIDGKLFVKRAMKNLSEIVSLKWLNGSAFVVFPSFEQIVFDFENRNTYMEFLSDEMVVCTTSLTDSETDFAGDILLETLSKSNMLKTTIKRCFEEITETKMPFSVSELNADRFADFVRFRGFPKDFYDAIPFWGGTRVVDDSFEEITDNLLNPESAMKLLENSSIPFCKSVKRVFAKRSGLLFYLKECEFLYSLLDDINIFCTNMNTQFIFDFLSVMHYYEYPMKTFLKDYATVLGKKRFSDKFSVSENLITYAIFYASLSDYVRKKEQEKWFKNIDVFKYFYRVVHRENNISIPMPRVTAGMKDCIIDKYRFMYLRTKQQHVVAGEMMKNCLGNWDPYCNPVVVIYKGDKITAAVEIFDDSVVQARECQNKSIKPASDLYNAIDKWCKKNNIKFEPENFNELPF